MTLREKILDTCNTIVNFRLPFNPVGNRYVLAANEIASYLGIDDIDGVFEIAKIIEKSEFNRDTLLGSNDKPEVNILVDSIISLWKEKYFNKIKGW